MRYSNLLLIIAAASMMQYHSIEFWIDQVGLPGVGWSLMLEATLIWFWWNKHSILAVFTSIILIAGPQYQLTQKAVDVIENQERITLQNNVDQIEKVRLQESLKTYERNSENRAGWLPKINRIQEQIDAISKRTRIRNQQISDFDSARSIAIAAAQSLTLVMIMIAQALAISKQKKISITIEKPKERTRPHKSRPSKNTEFEITKHDMGMDLSEINNTYLNRLIPQIPMALIENLAKYELNQSKWCEKHNISPKNLSLAKSHAANVKLKKETAPINVLMQIIKILEIQ